MEPSIKTLLADLIAIPSIDGNKQANDQALDYIEAFLAKQGMHCKRYRFDGNGALVASTRPDNAKTPTVLLAAHVDVMHGSDAMFTLRQEGDKLFGRGVYDMKFAIAGYLKLVSKLRDHLADYDFAIMITSDEEQGGRDGINGTRRLIEAGHKPKICILPDSAAPNWDVETLAKGHWRFELVAHGKTAHSSRPWEGESASSKLLKGLHELDYHFKDHGPLTDTLNIGVIKGGDTFNQIPSLMTASVEIRLSSAKAYKINKAYIDKLCARHGLMCHSKTIVQPYITNLDDPLVNTYLDSVQSVTGKRPQGVMSYAGTDAPYFDEVGVTCIVSCVNGGGHHSENEWISKNSLKHFVPILHDYLERASSVDKTTIAL